MYSSTSPAFQVRKTTAESGRWLSMNTRGGGLHGCVHGGGMDAQRGWSAIVSVSLPVMELEVASVAVTVCVPTVLNATCHGWLPTSTETNVEEVRGNSAAGPVDVLCTGPMSWLTVIPVPSLAVRLTVRTVRVLPELGRL